MEDGCFQPLNLKKFSPSHHALSSPFFLLFFFLPVTDSRAASSQSLKGKGEKKKVAIIGGGLSGLACAKYLVDAGHEPVVGRWCKLDPILKAPGIKIRY